MPSDIPVPTLDDVARLAGVSGATVSRCLNTPEKVSVRTRARVQSAVDTLGYTPNFAARSMAAKRSFTMGAIIPTMENAIFARGIQAFQEELLTQGYTLLVSSSLYNPQIEAEQIRALAARGVDGLLLIGADRDPEIYEFLRHRSIPALAAWVHDPACPIPCVGFDNHAAMRDMCQAVLDEGHTQIGVISGRTAGNDRAAARVAGVRAAVRHEGRDPNTVPVIETHYDIEAGAEAFKTLMVRHPDITAVLCGNDVLATGALRGARSMGLRVPEDVSVTGFDDLELARICVPELTTMHVPHRDMGLQAARGLMSMAAEKTEGTSFKLEASLERRASLGAPRAQS